jgi:tellurite resistance protein TerB
MTMGFFDDLKARASAMSKDASDGIKKFRNKDTLDALMAGCAYIAAADGTITPDEKAKMVGLVKNSSIVSVFDSGDAIKSFNKFAEKLEFDAGVGKSEVMLAVGKVRKNPDLARLVIRSCIIIAGADGNFDDHERAAVRAICLELGQSPADFDL